MRDFYAILGVSLDAELEVINAAYRAMAKKYHPDVYKGDKKFAEEKIKEINEAYECLSDAQKRKEYDSEFKKENKTGSFNDYNETSDDHDDTQNPYYKDAWSTIIEYFPGAETERKKLAKIQKKLGRRYQDTLITKRISKDYKIVSKLLKTEFFLRYFGKNKKIHTIIENLLIKNEVKIALEINKTIKILGDDASNEIIKKIREKYKNKINSLQIIDYEDQSKKIQTFVKNFNFIPKGNEKDYVYNYEFDNETNEIILKVNVFLNGDDNHEEPYPVVDYIINLEKKLLLSNETTIDDDLYYYETIDELIDFLDLQLTNNS